MPRRCLNWSKFAPSWNCERPAAELFVDYSGLTGKQDGRPGKLEWICGPCADEMYTICGPKSAAKTYRNNLKSIEDKKGWVYFYQLPGVGVKIGKTVWKPEERLANYRYPPHVGALLRAEYSNNRHDAEAAYHRRFASSALGHEWFKFAGPLREFLTEQEPGRSVLPAAYPPETLVLSA